MLRRRGYLVEAEFVNVEDSAEDIAVDVLSRMTGKNMSMADAFKDVGYEKIYEKTGFRTIGLPDDWAELPKKEKLKILVRAVTWAARKARFALAEK